MFKKFTAQEIGGTSQVKTSVRRNIRKKILQSYPEIEEDLDVMLPKRTPVFLTKCHNHISLVVCNKVCWFFQIRDGPFVPTLRVLHQYPDLLPKVKVDRGAIPFVLSGANIMCPGLTSKGGDCSIDVPKDTFVAVMAEGKEHALGIGLTKMSTEEIRTKNKGHGIENVHFLKDGLWDYEP